MRLIRVCAPRIRCCPAWTAEYPGRRHDRPAVRPGRHGGRRGRDCPLVAEPGRLFITSYVGAGEYPDSEPAIHMMAPYPRIGMLHSVLLVGRFVVRITEPDQTGHQRL
jgi:hypothetical protein